MEGKAIFTVLLLQLFSKQKELKLLRHESLSFFMQVEYFCDGVNLFNIIYKLLFPSEMASEIEESLTEMNNCMTLIIPDSLNFFIGSDKTTEVSTERHRDPDAWDEQPCCSKDLNKEAGRMAEATKSEEEKEDSCGESDMEDGMDEDVFIRSSGLMSHTYRLDLNVSSGWLTFRL